jgi:alkylhydroperoxidase family enzyme
MRHLPRVLVILVGILMVTTAEGQVRLSEPRIEPLAGGVDEWPADIQNAVQAFLGQSGAESPTNLIATLARHAPALNRLGPIVAYVSRDAMATAVDQVLLALRIAWLCRSEVIWSEQAAEAHALGLSEDELRRVAEGPDAGWGTWDATVIRAADELYRDSFLSDATWNAMANRYNARQMIDVIVTGAESIALSMTANSLGVQPDDRFPDRLPEGIARRAGLAPPSSARLETARSRLEPPSIAVWADQRRELLEPRDVGTDVTLSARVREILILRMGFLCGSDYQWTEHAPRGREAGLTDEELERIAVGPDAPGWGQVEAALLAAVDELYRDDTVGAATWEVLASEYDEQELIDVVITSAMSRVVSMALNSLGS